MLRRSLSALRSSPRTALWPRARLDDCRRGCSTTSTSAECVSCRRLSACFRWLRRLRACWVQLCGAACTANRLAQPRHPSRSSAQHSCDPKMSAALSCRRNSHALLVPCACPPVFIVSALVSGCEAPCQCGTSVTCRCPWLFSCRNVRAWSRRFHFMAAHGRSVVPQVYCM